VVQPALTYTMIRRITGCVWCGGGNGSGCTHQLPVVTVTVGFALAPCVSSCPHSVRPLLPSPRASPLALTPCVPSCPHPVRPFLPSSHASLLRLCFPFFFSCFCMSDCGCSKVCCVVEYYISAWSLQISFGTPNLLFGAHMSCCFARVCTDTCA
jgi:hypothetical protein